jgi:molybdenum cofactor cytidylyltransferase
VVTGAHHQQLQAVLDAGQVTIVYNHQWQQGMASSIRCGLLAVLEQPVPPQQVLFMVCDQPFVSAQLLQSLIAEYERTRKPVVASAYANTLGIPALFHTSLFAQLLGLQGDTGARKIIQQHAADTAAVAFPQGTIDVDTLEAYREITRP